MGNSKIAREAAGERERAPQQPSDSSWADGEARGDAHRCPDCGAPTSRDESWPPPFDVTCEKCRSIRSELQRRIERSVQSVKDVEAEETEWLFIPVRPAWAKWRRRP